MSDELKPGDVVRLKSGGPPMTVGDVYAEEGSAEAVWFNGRKFKVEPFNVHCLVKVENLPPCTVMGQPSPLKDWRQNSTITDRSDKPCDGMF